MPEHHAPAGRRTAMQTFAERAQSLMWLGLAGLGFGLSILLVYAWVEVINNPGHSLVDGYWIGRVPWTPIGVVLVLAGSAATLVAGAVAIVIRGDWVRRVLGVAVLLVPIAWSATAMGVIPFPRYQPPDPLTLAYSLPETAGVMLILPALAIATLALLPIRPDLRIRMRPVATADRHDQAG